MKIWEFPPEKQMLHFSKCFNEERNLNSVQLWKYNGKCSKHLRSKCSILHNVSKTNCNYFFFQTLHNCHLNIENDFMNIIMWCHLGKPGLWRDINKVSDKMPSLCAASDQSLDFSSQMSIDRKHFSHVLHNLKQYMHINILNMLIWKCTDCSSIRQVFPDDVTYSILVWCN